MTPDIGSMARAADSVRDFAKSYFERLTDVLGSLDLAALERFVETLETARTEGNTVFVAGNGGSATTATSMANDLGFDVLKKTGVERTFRIHALTDNVAALTAIGNDVGFDRIFVDQMRIHFSAGDVLVVISASGNSPNVVKAARWCREHGGTVVALVGFTGGALAELADIVLHFETANGEYGPVEDAHLVTNHVLAHWFQGRLTQAQDG